MTVDKKLNDGVIYTNKMPFKIRTIPAIITGLVVYFFAKMILVSILATLVIFFMSYKPRYYKNGKIIKI